MSDRLNKLDVTWVSKINVFETAFGRYYEELFLFCLKKVYSDDTAKDIVQETFIALWDNLDTLATEPEIKPYLYGVMRKKVLMQYRRSAVHLRYAVSTTGKDVEGETPGDLILTKELENVIAGEVNKMPARMQEIYLLKKESNHSIKEIAEKLGISEQTVKNQLQNAYGRLRIRINDYNSPVIVVGFVMSYMPILLHH